jgi:hypothetical protein
MKCTLATIRQTEAIADHMAVMQSIRGARLGLRLVTARKPVNQRTHQHEHHEDRCQ